MLRTILTMIALLAALPAQAQTQPAVKDGDGHLFCNNSKGADLRETGEGYKVNLVFEHLGDAPNAIYPAGGQKLFGPQTELRAYVSVNYEFLLGPDGNPRARPEPVRLALATGRFAGPRLEPLESLTLQLRAGDITSGPFRINSAYYNIALVGGEAAPPGSSNPYDTEWPRSVFDPLVMAFESKERWILLSQNGKEVARIPVPQRDISAERDAHIAYVRAAVPLLKQGKCPA